MARGHTNILIVKILEVQGDDYECLVANIPEWPNFRRYDGGIYERLVGDQWVVPWGFEKILEAAYIKAGGKRA